MIVFLESGPYGNHCEINAYTSSPWLFQSPVGHTRKKNKSEPPAPEAGNQNPAAHFLAQPFFAMSFGCGTGAAPGALGAKCSRGELEGLWFEISGGFKVQSLGFQRVEFDVGHGRTAVTAGVAIVKYRWIAVLA